MDTVVIMIIVWSVIVALAFLLEFLMYNMVSTWFAFGGIVALISAPFDLFWPWQILIFVTSSLIFLLAFRPFAVRFIKTKTTPTNLDANVGMKVKLLKDSDDGKSEIQINDIVWKVACPEGSKIGDVMFITGMQGNKYIVDVNKKEETQ